MPNASARDIARAFCLRFPATLCIRGQPIYEIEDALAELIASTDRPHHNACNLSFSYSCSGACCPCWCHPSDPVSHEENGCGAESPNGYRCTHHYENAHHAHGTEPGSWADSWPFDKDQGE